MNARVAAIILAMAWRRSQLLFPAAVALLTFFAFLPALQNDFLNWDDSTNFLRNTSYRGLGWEQLKWMWTSHLTGHYIPVTWMTLGLDYTLWGMNPQGYHLTNIVFHTANAVLLYFLALTLFRIATAARPEDAGFRLRLAALFAALVFAVHPLRAESVAWVTERRDVVCGFFYLLAILAYVRGHKFYWTSLALFALAVLSKEIAVTLPVVLLILDVYPLRRLGGAPGRWSGASVRSVWLEKLPFLAIAVTDSLLALDVSKHAYSYTTLASSDWLSRAAAAIYGLSFYVWKTLAPLALTPYYPLTPHKIDPWAAPLQVSLAVVLAITIASILLRRNFPALLAAWLAYAVTLFPVLGIFDNGAQIAADRYSYLACLGWALLAGASLLPWRLGKRELPILAVAALLVLVLASLTRRQVQIWRDSDTLWTYALAVEPSFVANVNMGEVLMDRGDYLWASEHFREAIHVRPDFPSAHLGLAGSLFSLGNATEAAREFRLASKLGPSREVAENGLACALALQGKLDEAIEHFHEALRINPEYQAARGNLQQVLAKKSSVNPSYRNDRLLLR